MNWPLQKAFKTMFCEDSFQLWRVNQYAPVLIYKQGQRWQELSQCHLPTACPPSGHTMGEGKCREWEHHSRARRCAQGQKGQAQHRRLSQALGARGELWKSITPVARCALLMLPPTYTSREHPWRSLKDIRCRA